METNFKPNYAIHPGVFLKDEMKALNITQKELSEKIKVSKTIINEIVKGKRDMYADLAVKLERVLESPASYWLNLQALYDEAVARLKLQEQERQEERKEFTWGKLFVVENSEISLGENRIYYSYRVLRKQEGVA